MNKTYIVITTSADGIRIDSMSREALIDALNERDYGDLKILKSIPDSDPDYWGDAMLILCGEVVVPTPVETVTEYKL